MTLILGLCACHSLLKLLVCREVPTSQSTRRRRRPEGPLRLLNRGAILHAKLMANEYVEQRDGGYYIAGARVTLDSVVYCFLAGESPEGIVESFPALDLEQVYGAIAYYLANRQAVDAHLERGRAEFDRLREEARRKYPLLYAKLDAAKRAAPVHQP
jgi:uncharacterized protein (DUF433 family)